MKKKRKGRRGDSFFSFLFFSFARGESDKAMYAEYLFDQKS